MINRLYDMPLRFGYWLLMPFILIYYILTTKQPKTTFLLNWCGMQLTFSPDEMIGLPEEQTKLILEYMRRHPE
jgi:hypothetical protein